MGASRLAQSRVLSAPRLQRLARCAARAWARRARASRGRIALRSLLSVQRQDRLGATALAKRKGRDLSPDAVQPSVALPSAYAKW